MSLWTQESISEWRACNYIDVAVYIWWIYVFLFTMWGKLWLTQQTATENLPETDEAFLWSNHPQMSTASTCVCLSRLNLGSRILAQNTSSAVFLLTIQNLSQRTVKYIALKIWYLEVQQNFKAKKGQFLETFASGFTSTGKSANVIFVCVWRPRKKVRTFKCWSQVPCFGQKACFKRQIIF